MKHGGIGPCMGIPVRYEPTLGPVCDSRLNEIVVGPAFLRFPPGEQSALLLHEVGHCKLRHIRARILTLLTRPWRLAALCREQEFEADRFARGLGHGPALAAALARLTVPEPRTWIERAARRLHPPRSARIARLI